MKIFYQFFLVITLFISVSGCDRNERVILTEILVVGGGTSGVCAGIQGARSGAKTVIVEPTPWLGGMLTAAGVSATDGNHRLPSGLWGEFRKRIYAHYGGSDKVNTGWVSNTLFEPHVGDSIFKQMSMEEKNLEILYGYRFKEAIMNDQKIQGGVFVEVESGKTLTIYADNIIDATELGDVAGAAGVEYDIGMDPTQETGEKWAPVKENNIIQDLTYVAILKNYGEDQAASINKPANYDPSLFTCSCRGVCPDSTYSVVDCRAFIIYGHLPGNKYMINWPINGNDYYINVIELSHEDRKKAYQEAKDHTLNFIYFIQNELGFKNLGLADDEYTTKDLLPFIPYHRESRRIKGLVRFTLNDILDPYDRPSDLYRTSIAVGDYPVDHHHDKNPEAHQVNYPAIPSFAIPVGVMIPQRIEGLIVAEKSISVTHLVNGCTRLQPVVMGIGQAAGIIASLALDGQMPPAEVPIREVQQKLLDANCWLLPFIDVSPEDKIFKSVQKTGLCGLLKGTGVPNNWANQTWFYPDSILTHKMVVGGLEEFFSHPMTMGSRSAGPVSIQEVIPYLKSLKNKILAENQRNDTGQGQAFPEINTESVHDVINEFFPGRNNITGEYITRAEYAVLINQLIDPFRLRVDQKGRYSSPVSE